MSKSTSPYYEAGSILDELLSSKSGGGRGLKSIAFSKNKTKGGPNKATYATICKSMQHLPLINSVLNDDGGKLRKGIGLDTVHNKGLMYVMLYELLFGKYKSIRGGGRLKRMIVKHERELREGVSKHEKNGGGLNGGTVQFPRYVRVNVVKASVDEIVKLLKESIADPSKERQADVSTELKQSIFVDAHVPDLLVLHPSASSLLHQEHEAVKLGKIVLQDKSSCLSALVLARGNPNLSLDCDFIDACAAPGNKTTHLAALVSQAYTMQQPKKKRGKKTKPNSTIFAFERSSARFKVLQSRAETLIPSSTENSLSPKVVIHPVLGDFLKSDPKDPQFANVKGILLDPSCSGSGIVNSPDRWLEDAEIDGNDKTTMEEKAKRIQSLANFQLVALKHAMSFPSVDRIVYSTCSVHDEENEIVVGKALSEANGSMEGADGDEWILVAPACLNPWHRRGNSGGVGGLLSEDQARCLIRCDGLDGDETNGFFVGYFERKRVGSNRDAGDMRASNVSVNKFDLPVYEGQFANIDNVKSETPAAPVSKAGAKEKSLPSRKPKQQTQSTSDKSQQKVAKKREKKLAWKRKQALQKAQRLKKGKDKVTDSVS
jgi:putative methyltransferase